MATYQSVNGKAPSGLKSGDKVVTNGGTYTITGVKSDGTYSSTKSSNTNKSTYTGSYSTAPTTTSSSISTKSSSGSSSSSSKSSSSSSSGSSILSKLTSGITNTVQNTANVISNLSKKSSSSSGSSNTSTNTTNSTNTSGVTPTGNVYSSISGKAQSGLSVGDQVVTNGGTYLITGVNADGTYQKVLYNNTTKGTYTGTYANNNYETANFQQQINDAVASGNYTLASQLENSRNDKINMLNSAGTNTNNYTTTNNYNYSSLSDLANTNWTSATVNNQQYTRDSSSGKIYDSNSNYLGDGYNTSTGEFTYSNISDATQVAKLSFKSALGFGDYSDDDALNYISTITGNQIGMNEIVEAYQTGQVSNLKNALQQASESYQKQLAIQQYYEEQLKAQQEALAAQQEQYQIDIDTYLNNLANVTSDDVEQTSSQSAKDIYLDSVKKRILNGRMNIR